MDNEFSIEEIREVAKLATVYCPGFSQEQFESLMELERHTPESGYLEAAKGLARLEKEKGVYCAEALDAFKELSENNIKLGKLVKGLETRVQQLEEQVRHAKGEYEQVKKATDQAQRELAEIRSKRAREEEDLNNFRKKAEVAKRRIDTEFQEYREHADVTREEVDAASQIKSSAKSHGLGLDLVLSLSQELAGHQNARDKLAEGLRKHDSLIKYLEDLTKSAENARTALKSELASLESQKNSLEGNRRNMEAVLSQLQADINYEEELRRFHRRYQGVRGLMEHLAGWNGVFFMRCNNPLFALTGAFDRNSGNARFWTDKRPAMCPQCGCRDLIFDKEAYQSLNCPVGTPLRLRLGE